MATHVKYPRTMHVPWSPGMTSDDKVIADFMDLTDAEIIISEKLDGECTTFYSDGYHARSLDSRHHKSRDWIAQFHASIASDIPEHLRICGENLYARHSVAYLELPSYFMAYSIWDGDICLSWDDTIEWLNLIGITPVTVLFRGQFDVNHIKKFTSNFDTTRREGIVIRPTASFKADEFSTKVCKWVRKGHVQTDQHWMHSEIIPNGLRRD